MKTNPTIIVHIPYELKENPRIAPQIRPQRMIASFERIGCSTIVVSGTAGQRKRQMRNIRNEIRSGHLHVDFVYAESSGWPNAFSDGRRSFHPYLDERFLKALDRTGVPVSLFYRDVYHRSQMFFEVSITKKPVRTLLKFLYRRDLKRYNDYVTILYLPSIEMRTQIPEYKGDALALPPGAKLNTSIGRRGPANDNLLHLLYVGGLGELYRLHHLFEAVASTPGARLTVCTRESDWMAVQSEYVRHLGPRISIVHQSGEKLDRLYEQADIAIIAFEPNPYRDFAVPVKLFEYIGQGKAIIASEGTLAGTYVSDHHLGWSVPYAVENLASLLSHLVSPEGGQMVRENSASAANHAPSVSWECRAQQVVADFLLWSESRGS